MIEEPEAGPHPNGIGAVINLVMELLLRGYRVCLSTHSAHPLPIFWALHFFQENNGQPRDVLSLKSANKDTEAGRGCARERFQDLLFCQRWNRAGHFLP